MFVDYFYSYHAFFNFISLPGQMENVQVMINHKENHTYIMKMYRITYYYVAVYHSASIWWPLWQKNNYDQRFSVFEYHFGICVGKNHKFSFMYLNMAEKGPKNGKKGPAKIKKITLFEYFYVHQ